MNDRIDRRRAPGKLTKLGEVLQAQPLPGHTGIGTHAGPTHGAPTESNAHPHMSSRVALVHNGIIENFRELRDVLIAKGHTFESETTPKSRCISSRLSRHGPRCRTRRHRSGEAADGAPMRLR